MQWILTCDNGKEIDMTHYIGKQMDGELTREDVENRIEFYKSTNKLWENLTIRRYLVSVLSR